ncbi:hypothetical protein Tcan_12111 [Toxocara canis]|uniref:Uncharacterized protein n=1 Tax=Toxocara canis TaxID=6265 RepID=A0A0B2UZ06_TOXCA|nr:hypothetical protein Tcan_12111 [Toxocara canis]
MADRLIPVPLSSAPTDQAVIGGDMADRLIPVPLSSAPTDQAVSASKLLRSRLLTQCRLFSKAALSLSKNRKKTFVWIRWNPYENFSSLKRSVSERLLESETSLYEKKRYIRNSSLQNASVFKVPRSTFETEKAARLGLVNKSEVVVRH